MSLNADEPQRGASGGRGTPPPSSAGGDLVDQAREWFDRLRERVGGRGGTPRQPAPRPGRRSSLRSQAVPLGSEQARAGAARRGSDRRSGTAGRADRAERNAYTLVFGAVLITLVVGLIFASSWLLGSGGPFGSSTTPTPKLGAQPTPLPNPGAVASPLPFASPSPSPSPDASPAAPLTGRVHVVEAGDTLNRIAQRYGVTVEQIVRANSFSDRNRILRIGERLVIPDAAVTASPIPR